MVRKIRFPLEMKNGIEVRTIEELKDNFSIEQIIQYLENGKLIIWLRDRYENDKADDLEEIDLNDSELIRKICNVFDIDYDESMKQELEKSKERLKKISILKEYTDNKEYEKVIDNIAFNQDDLYDLLDENINKIYLCGNNFSIPLSKKGITYIGINKPIVIIDSKEEIDWEEKEIILENVVFDKKYQDIIYKYSKYIGEYKGDTCLSYMLSVENKKMVKELFTIVKQEMGRIDFNKNSLKDYEKLIKENKIVNLAEKYIELL